MWYKEEIDLYESTMLRNEIVSNITRDAVKNMYKPEELYTKAELTRWAEENFDASDIAVTKEVIARGWQPEDVFSDEKLLEWARARGFDTRVRLVK